MSDRLDAELYDGPEAIHAAQRAEIARLRRIIAAVAGADPVNVYDHCCWCGGPYSMAYGPRHDGPCPWLALQAEAAKENR